MDVAFQMSLRRGASYGQPWCEIAGAWLSMLRLIALGGERDAAYWSAQLAAYGSASNTDMCHGRGRGWEPIMELGGWRWTKQFQLVFRFSSHQGRGGLSR